MAKNNNVLETMLENPNIKRLGLNREKLSYILRLYSEEALKNLLEYGFIELGNGLFIEVVQLTDRVHALRGVLYKSNRKYKLKLTMEDIIYKQIEKYYSELEDNIS